MKYFLTISEQSLRKREHGDLWLDIRPERRELRYNDKTMVLPPRLFRLAQILVTNPGREMTHWEIFYHVYGEGSADGGPLCDSENITDLCARLRIKLFPWGLTVKSVRKGYGYKLLELEKEQEDVGVQEVPKEADR